MKVLFASAREPVIALVIRRYAAILPELPLLVVAEFAPPSGDIPLEWVRYHIQRSEEDNLAKIRAHLSGRAVRLSAVILEPGLPYWKMRKLGFRLAPLRFLAFNETGEHFILRPRSVPTMIRHALWRLKNLARSQRKPDSRLRRVAAILTHPEELRLSLLYRSAMARGRRLAASRATAPYAPLQNASRPSGISIVIPSRNGRDLLDRCLASLAGELSTSTEIIVVDNGSGDRTVEWLAEAYPGTFVEHSDAPLPFAVAVNRGIARARYSHVCVLNNDMRVEPGFFAALRTPFDSVPDLFCSSAQIFFPEGQRREETGKTVLNPSPGVDEFPVRCDVPFDNEDASYVLYGSGGCSLYDAAKLAALGGFDEAYQPAYVEDLDLGVRAWLLGWPSVYCAGARVLHQHRATTSRYFTPAELDLALERNYLHFLTRTIADPGHFLAMWNHSVLRLKAHRKTDALRVAARQPSTPAARGDLGFLDLVNGEVSVFPGHPPRGMPVILIASPYLPFPLSHGAAVRIYNLMRETAHDFDLVLLAFVEQPGPAPQELLDLAVEVITVHRPGTHAPPSRGRPDTVEEFDSPAFHAALRQTIVKWSPGVVQLEFTQMAAYTSDSAPARTILVEHDITYDLYAQMLAQQAEDRGEDWETRRQHDLWRAFETEAWNRVDRLVTMSEKDRAMVAAAGIARALAIPNGVDLERFEPSPDIAPEPRRLLFIGSFAHRPNVLALEFFLRDVFPRLSGVTLHVIAGQRHETFWDLKHPGVEVEGFVADVRPAYRRATLVIAPLVASAGTNVKILEAMAMGKAIVSTSAGIHGLTELTPGADVIVADQPERIAEAIDRLLDQSDERRSIEQQARATAQRCFGWSAIGQIQKRLYEELLGNAAAEASG